MRPGAMRRLYRDRPLSEGHPDIDRLAHDTYLARLAERGDETWRTERLLACLGRLIDLADARDVLVLGCGPAPRAMRVLARRGYAVTGVEPTPSFARAAADYAGTDGTILEGAAERIPLPDASRDIIVCVDVLEHVDSPERSADEMFRVLRPGGVAWIETQNRYRFSPTGAGSEFTVPFYNWLPRIVRESFVFQHLHYQPGLARYTARPAVHWWSYAELCALGRRAGFASFYSPIDLIRTEDEPWARGALRRRLRRFLLPRIQTSPWLRALALTQYGDAIVMRKRPG